MIVAMASFEDREVADEDELARTFERMREIVVTIPGFISNDAYVGEDGEEIGRHTDGDLTHLVIGR